MSKWSANWIPNLYLPIEMVSATRVGMITRGSTWADHLSSGDVEAPFYLKCGGNTFEFSHLVHPGTGAEIIRVTDEDGTGCNVYALTGHTVNGQFLSVQNTNGYMRAKDPPWNFIFGLITERYPGPLFMSQIATCLKQMAAEAERSAAV